LGKVLDCGVGRGAATVVMIGGVLLAVTATFVWIPKSIRELENN